jgi:hypothetical protein
MCALATAPPPLLLDPFALDRCRQPERAIQITGME